MALIQCPRCSAALPGPDQDCSRCGYNFAAEKNRPRPMAVAAAPMQYPGLTAPGGAYPPPPPPAQSDPFQLWMDVFCSQLHRIANVLERMERSAMIALKGDEPTDEQSPPASTTPPTS